MYVIDITRDSNKTDMLCGNNSMDAKNKTLNYIIDYTMANHNIYIDKDLLDQNLNIESFSLNKFLNDYYSINIENDLLIQSVITNKDNCLFVKFRDDKTNIPVLYSLNKNDDNIARNILTYLINDSLIEKYENNISKYDKEKLDYNSKELKINYEKNNIKGEVISLYNYKGKGLFLEELLNNACSLNQVKNKEYGGMPI